MNFEIENITSLQLALDEFCRFLRRERVVENVVFDCRLAFSELAGNVLRHTGDVASVTSEVMDGKIKLVVKSNTPFLPPAKSKLPDDIYAESGRGLFLVDSVVENRFVTDEGGICVVISMKKKVDK